MSRYSGKCDVYDWFVRNDGAVDLERLRNVDFRIGDGEAFRIETERELVPLYPYVVCVAVMSKDGGSVRLTEKPWIDREEEDWMGFVLESVKKIARRAKRKKEPFDAKKAVEEVSFFTSRNLAERCADLVAEKGQKATVADLKATGFATPMAERYRKEMREEMARNGYSPDEIEAAGYGRD